jgi:hypothetical protein
LFDGRPSDQQCTILLSTGKMTEVLQKAVETPLASIQRHLQA